MIRLVTFLGGLYFFLEFLLPKEFFGFSFAPYHEFITNGFIAVGVTAVGLGLISILRVHGTRTLKRSAGWISSSLLLISMFTMIFVTSQEAIFDNRDSKLIERASLLKEFAVIVHRDGATSSMPVEQRTTIAFDAITKFESDLNDLPVIPGTIYDELSKIRAEIRTTLSSPSQSELVKVSENLSALVVALRSYRTLIRERSANRSAYRLLYQGLWTALAAAMFSLLGFYIAAAAFRAFRVRSVESALMMCSAVIVMLGQIPFGVWLHEGLPALRSWLLSVPSSAAFRAIRIGAGVAGLLMALRMWLSLDRRGGRA